MIITISGVVVAETFFNWKIPFLEMEKKRLKCWKWKVQITDCRYRPINQLYDYFNARISQTSKDYYIHPNWTDAKVKQFRRNVRKQNICARHGFPFHSGLLERKGVAKKLSMELRDLPREKVLQKVPDAWFPDKICKPPMKCFQNSKENRASRKER